MFIDFEKTTFLDIVDSCYKLYPKETKTDEELDNEFMATGYQVHGIISSVKGLIFTPYQLKFFLSISKMWPQHFWVKVKSLQ